MQQYPNDATGDALRRVADDGHDMGKPMKLDFAVAVSEEAAGRLVAQAAIARGYSPRVARDDLDGSWTVYCTKLMLATHESITAAEAELDALAKPFGGYGDGWGTFGNADDH